MVATPPTEVHTFNLPIGDVKWCTVALSDVIKAGKRLEAAVFDIDGKHAREIVTSCKWEAVPLPTILEKAYYPGRFKRIYCNSHRGESFFLPSQMTDIYPKTDKYISKLTKCNISQLRLQKGDVLLTRSGTIGNTTIVSRTLENKVFSDDVIRITPMDGLAGYVYAFLRSHTGNTILQTNNYGSVIKHIEPAHLAEIPIPIPPIMIKEKINDLILHSFELRDRSNELLDTATALLIKELKLPSIEEFAAAQFNNSAGINKYSTKLSDLSGRLDSSYHIPIVNAIKSHLQKHADKLTTVGDTKITSAIILAGIFKRIYVEEGYGIPFLGGKEITQLDPKTEKFLSRPHHLARYKKELRVSENMVLVTNRGSIGITSFVPKHWDGWAVSQNVLKIIPASNEVAGYLFVFLQSDWGKLLIQRQTYGSVVDMIDNNKMANVEFPILRSKEVQAEINHLALEVNQLRYQAYLCEQEAMKALNEEVLFA